ncbi:MAG TPA: hypothetical protein VFT64_07600 [Rickettsiales bacterium]|nr:hypothetical protein [Rickettsiales bacterium]
MPLDTDQPDQRRYLDEVGLKEARQYASYYKTGMIPGPDGAPLGIGAEDFEMFVAVVLGTKQQRHIYDQIHARGGQVTHVDLGTGPAPENLIAAIGYADKSIAVDLSPGNLAYLEDIKNPKTPLEPHLQAWLEMATIIYDLGSVQKLIELDRKIPDIG